MGKFTDNLARKRKPEWRDDGDCYEASATFVLDLKRDPKWRHFDTEGCVLVHGRPTLQRPPENKYDHAWIELPEHTLALNVATGREAAIPIPTYYEAGRIDPAECYRYTAEQARQMLLEFGHYGPWEGDGAVPPTQGDHP